MRSLPLNTERRRRFVSALAATLLLSALPANLALVAVPAGALVITTTDDGRAELVLPVSGIPARFNLSLPAGALVTSLTLEVSTAPGAAPPEVPANVALDLGLDGVDWAFGGGPEGALGFQQTLASGAASASLAVGAGAASFSFVLPRGADVSALRFLATPRVNMSLWNASEFVSVVSGNSAVPLNLTANSAPALGDLGGDGRADLLATGEDGALHLFSLVGAAGLLFEDNQSALPSGLARGRTLMDPQIADLDGDGAPDIVTGSASSGLVAFLTQTATPGPPLDFMENTSYFSGIPAYTNASPALGDLDGDGDLDLVVGDSSGSFFHYRNEIGEGTGLDWRVLSTFISPALAVGGDASPALVDLDSDGDLDLISGAGDGSFTFFENTGDQAAAAFEAAGTFPGLVAGARSTPALADWTQDGRPDLFYGARSGLVLFSQSLGGLPSDVEVSVSGGTGTLLVQPGVLAAPAAVSLPGAMLAPIAGALLPLSSDAWGNALATVKVVLAASHFGQVEVSALEVEYSATLAVPDLAGAYGTFAQGALPVGNRTVVPFRLSGAPLVPATAPLVRVGSFVVRIDDSPAFVSVPALVLDEDTFNPRLFDLASALQDEDAVNATYSVLAATNDTFVHVAIDGGHFLSADALTGDYNNNWTGFAEVIVRAVDARGQAATSGVIPLRVVNLEDAPIVEYIPARYLGPSDTLRLTARAIDGDADAVLRYSLLPPSPNSATIDAVTGLLTWNPSTADRMLSARFVVAVTDGELADTQAFDVYFLPAPQPVFGRQFPRVAVLPGRPEFLNIFDFATGNVSSVRSLTLAGPAHPHVNLSASGEWLAFDYPSDFAAGSDRVELALTSEAGNESVAVEVTILPVPGGLNLAPFPPTPLARGVQHRVELLRYAGRIADFRNLSFEVDHPFAKVDGFNLSLYVPLDYALSSILLPATVRAGAESASTTWAVQVASPFAIPRVGRAALIAGGARDIDLGYILAPFALESQRFPLSTDSPHLTALGGAAFRVSFPPWPSDERAREFWPVERARVLDSTGAAVVEVEIGYDGRSRYLDRVQYFTEDEKRTVDASFALDERYVGRVVSNISLAGTGPYVAGPLESIARLDGSGGVGWRAAFTRDTALEQLTVVALTDASTEGGGSLSFSLWAVVLARDDAPVYQGGLGNLRVDPGLNLTVDLSGYFGDEEGDDLSFSLTASAAGVAVDRASGWLTVDGRVAVNLTGVKVVASETKNATLQATSAPINIRVEAAATPPQAADPTSGGFWAGWAATLLLLGLLASAGAGAFAVLWRRLDDEEEAADAAVDDLVGAVGSGEEWEAVRRARPPPGPPPNPDDPQMQALEAEWSRVIASRQTEAASEAGDTEAEFQGKRKGAHGAIAPAAQEPPRPVKMTSSDTETERKAGETDADIDVKKRRAPR